ncbi:type I-C CRISPR-associated endonuclease Cas1c [Vagococcus acidifermentans]|uniref:CRISPR-associated endonuclease Cas1 n=1 Tax=Vagococcus acidifermentans TaxID=564710 RepID=A0A430AQT1_9ENTE|nr:type I-C CRISPR-associated endonuclease Cas1c [Vagococcus acidifermentans]RSU10478.1 subtype I-C CRISPR-associated endonuclease Cas1 [Vagococcus acidifermentans]
MRALLNTLFITTPKAYLSLEGANVLVNKDEEVLGRVPLHNLEQIVTLGYAGASPALMYACVERNISIAFLSTTGKFRARVVGESRGNVVLRKKQYRLSDDEQASCMIARNFITGKVYNQRWVIERTTRDHGLRIDVPKFKEVSLDLFSCLQGIRHIEDLENLRGFEGQAASRYNQLFDDMILQQKKDFFFYGRNRRPPLDNVNAMLSFAYTLLANDMASALEAVGLDAYVGFLHRDRPGRVSLALDMIEELRAIYADRFVLTLINKRIVNGKGFLAKENGAVIMTDDTRKIFINAWQERKQQKIQHPFLGEKISWGLVPYVQALLLARYIRGDLDEYPPFLWK